MDSHHPEFSPPPPTPGGQGPGGPGGEGHGEERWGPSWELRARLGFGKALLRTLVEVLFFPHDTFHHAKPAGGIISPLLFAVIIAVIVFPLVGQIAYALNQVTLPFLQPAFPLYEDLFGEAFMTQFMEAISQRPSVLRSIIRGPSCTVLYLFLAAAMAHLMLLIVGGAQREFEATFRVIAYAFGSTLIIGLIPFCGLFPVQTIWMFVTVVIGLAQMHETDAWRAFMAQLFTFPTCCCLFVFGA